VINLNEGAMADPAPAQPGARLFDIYRDTPYLSIKHSSYFHVYETLFGPYIGRPITFVEVGVLNGGSLFMWRRYLGPQARIIGIDLNPAARKWQSEGFEIHIGSQSDPAFWDRFQREVGPVDILLDDGGHTNAQQIVTVQKAMDIVKDGGLIVVEDTHCSYLTEFGNPSGHSFISFCKRLVDHVQARYPKIRPPRQKFGECVASIRFFESIVALEIDRRLCFKPAPTTNDGISADARDFRYEGSAATLIRHLEQRLSGLSRVPLLWRVRHLFPLMLGLLGWWESRRLRRLFD
jgi:hypothetical protein